MQLRDNSDFHIQYPVDYALELEQDYWAFFGLTRISQPVCFVGYFVILNNVVERKSYSHCQYPCGYYEM